MYIEIYINYECCLNSCIDYYVLLKCCFLKTIVYRILSLIKKSNQKNSDRYFLLK